MRKASQILYVVMWLRWSGCIHKPCLAREADTWSASVDSCGESAMLMLPEEDMVLSCWGESSKETISAPWSVRALAVSRKFSLWLSICGQITGEGQTRHKGHILYQLLGDWMICGEKDVGCLLLLI